MKTRLDIIDPCDIHSEIIRKRNELNLSQKELSRKLNTSNTRLCLIENGKHNLTITQAEEIFKQMGYSLQIALTEIK